MRSGHISGSINTPFASLLNEDGTLKANEQLRAIFEERKVEVNKFTINSCGSGVTACIVDLALRILGNEHKTKVYDGSWSEYGRVEEPKLSAKKEFGEADVGITRFLTEGLTALPCAIKHRYSDFIVNEIDKHGEVVWFVSELGNQTKWKQENIKETLPESVLD